MLLGNLKRVKRFSTLKLLASLDQSTTGTKFTLYEQDGTLVDQEVIGHEQISQHKGWVQHNPTQIYTNAQQSILNVMKRVKVDSSNILGLGISNQRQTVVCWDEQGNPLNNALVWCDTRTKAICEQFSLKYANKFNSMTGLPVSIYFSLFKILWMLQNVSGLREKVKTGRVKFGTIDSWMAYKLTGKYVTDASNASRTYLCNINTGSWDPELLNIVGLTLNNVPTIVKSFQTIGDITEGSLKGVPVSCILGDQQASVYAHNLSTDQMKITFGTGCFLLSNIGTNPTFDPSCVTTILNRNQNDQLNYGFEVSVECGGGTLNWAKRLGLFQDYSELNHLPQTEKNLYFFPSFGSIFSPFWDNNVAGGIVGMGFDTTRQHILKAILHSITFRLYDNIKNSKFEKIKKIIVDGGMTKNKEFMQMQADLFGKQIEVRKLDTCWGVAKGVLSANGMPINEKKLSTTNYLPKERTQILNKYEEWCRQRNKFYGWK